METPTQHLYKQCQAEKRKKTQPFLLLFSHSMAQLHGTDLKKFSQIERKPEGVKQVYFSINNIMFYLTEILQQFLHFMSC